MDFLTGRRIRMPENLIGTRGLISKGEVSLITVAKLEAVSVEEVEALQEATKGKVEVVTEVAIEAVMAKPKTRSESKLC